MVDDNRLVIVLVKDCWPSTTLVEDEKSVSVVVNNLGLVSVLKFGVVEDISPVVVLVKITWVAGTLVEDSVLVSILVDST